MFTLVMLGWIFLPVYRASGVNTDTQFESGFQCVDSVVYMRDTEREREKKRDMRREER